LNCQLDDPDARVHVGRKSGGGQHRQYGKEKESRWYTVLNRVVQEYERYQVGWIDEYISYNAYFGEPKGFDRLREALEDYVETNQEKNYL
jgi:hypothetical protein